MTSHRTLPLFPIALLLSAGTAAAKDPTLELMAQKGLVTADEYAAIKAEQKDQASISLKDGLKITSNDGNSSFRFNTLLQVDAAYFRRDGANIDAADGTELRRARLAISGNAGKWDYRLEGEFAGTATLTDAYGTWNGPVGITTGNFKLPYSLESLMSDKNLAFMERSLSSAFLPARAPGLMLSDGNASGGWAIGLFGEPLSTATPPTLSGSSAAATTDDEGGGISVRASHAFFVNLDHLLHAAASLHYRVPTQGGKNASETLRITSRPEANQFTDKLVNTKDISGDVDSYQLAGFELAGEIGSLLLQGEYTTARVERNLAMDAHFEGGYVQGSYAITGEKRAYKAEKGIFEGVVPRGKIAWEVAARVSQLDLVDAGVNGGRETNASLAVNAYFGPAVKLSLNYVKVLETEDGPFPGDEPVATMLRAQFAY